MKLLLIYFDNKADKMLVEKTDAAGKKIIVPSSEYNFVYRDEIVARVIDVNTPEDAKKYMDPGHTYYNAISYIKFKIGTGIYFDEQNKSYKASMYGFVVLDKAGTLRIISPLQINKEKTKAYYWIFPTKDKQIPSYSHIEEILKFNKIITILDRSEIDRKISSINTSVNALTRIKVAQSKSPVTGRREYYMPLTNVDKKAGKVMSDGHIDFKEVDSIIQITKGQELLQRFPEIIPIDGYTIFGEKLLAQVEATGGFQKGDNIIPSPADENIFVSGIDGCLSVIKNKISIEPMAIINGNVDYDSGNIDFNGSVHIMGSVLPGFSVKAKADIIVDGSVDDATLIAEGDIIVKMGISGKGSTVVKANGNIGCKFILNAKVEALQSITVDDSIINSNVSSNDKISVVSQHGKIMGGETLARHEIAVNTAGSSKETTTILTVGKNIEVEKEIQQIRQEMAHIKQMVEDIMQKIRSNYGNNLFEDPKKFISILPDIKKKQCIQLLADLSNLNKDLKALAVQGMKAEEKLVFDMEPQIIAKEKIFPGTQIFIKKRTRKIEHEITNAKFFEDPEEKVIKFTSAV
ncbi:MAG: DUF342 domain-containing protein [Spirochaetes bacterium]|nr:DUF342 domain-containing protein [Spirochaetota bacterium]